MKLSKIWNRRGFTLIELLIVVAIIAILAAIAVPNFLEAQVRSKVSRTFSDIRTMRTGLEAYRVDANRYPETDRGILALQNNNMLSIYRLTTPISYLTTVPTSPWKENYGTGDPNSPKIAQSVTSFLYVRKLTDPLAPGGTNPNFPDVNPEYAADRSAYILQGQLAPFGERSKGEWMIKSSGPNGEDDRNVRGAQARLYDPTNGTVSDGDIAVFSDLPTGRL